MPDAQPLEALYELPFLWETLERENRPVVLYGMGDGADRILRTCGAHGIKVRGVFASDDFVRGQTYQGYTVRTYPQTVAQFPDCVVLLAFGTHRPDVIERIRNIAAERPLYLPDMEVVSGEPYNRARFQRDAARLGQVCDLIHDESGRRTFLNLLRFKITGNIEFLGRCWQAPSRSLPLHSEHVLDGGAYTGDTAKGFLETAGACRSLTACEPDPRSYKKLLRALEPYPSARAVPAALGARDGAVLFSAAGGRQSRVGGGSEVSQVAIDSLDRDFTFIKLDLEGREVAALQGARALIRRIHPKLQVSAYHRHSDLYTIPLYVRRLWPGYRVTLRSARALPAWDTYWDIW